MSNCLFVCLFVCLFWLFAHLLACLWFIVVLVVCSFVGLFMVYCCCSFVGLFMVYCCLGCLLICWLVYGLLLFWLFAHLLACL